MDLPINLQADPAEVSSWADDAGPSVHLATSPAGTSLPPIRRFVVACGMRRTLRRGPLPDNYDDVRAFPDVKGVNTELLNLDRASGADTNLGVSLPDED